MAQPFTEMGHIERYWYIYEAPDIDLTDGSWRTRSSTGIDWEFVSPDTRLVYEEIQRTGWDGTGDWYEREQDLPLPPMHYPVVQLVHKPETDTKHLLTLVPFPDRGEPLFVFWLTYPPVFLERREDDARYSPTETM